MNLWLRHKNARFLNWEQKLDVASQAEWLEAIADPTIVSSILWPAEPGFPLSGRHYGGRRHAHELNYSNDPARNAAYRKGAIALANRIHEELAGARILVYAPIRGALPIWNAIAGWLPDVAFNVYWPVTSSFVVPRKVANRLELVRLRPLLEDYDVLLYVDEIVSGGMMRGHLNDLAELDIGQDVCIAAVGLADRNGERGLTNINWFRQLEAKGKLLFFAWEGVPSLITEDQKYLLGVHYVDNSLGPHAVPMLNEFGEFYDEKLLFDLEVNAPGGNGDLQANAPSPREGQSE
jgi:hypothetical protein